MVTYPWSRVEPPPAKPKSRFHRYLGRHIQGVAVTLMVTLLLGFVLYPYMLVTVPSGEVGVLWKRFSGPGIYCWCILRRGTVLNPEEIRNEGLHLLWPWDKLFLYDLRLQSKTEKFNAISSDGVNVSAEINIRYQLNHDSAAVLHKFIGPGYMTSLLAPQIGSETRRVIARYTAYDVYISREKIQEEIKEAARRSLGAQLNNLFEVSASEQQDASLYAGALENSIKILDTLVLSIELPESIVSAINRQMEQFYQIQEAKYRAQRESQESERKQIEANGIAAFQKTVSQGISESYLRWRGIEATLALAQSQNAKIVIIGSGKDGLPIILGNVDAAPPTNPGDKRNEKPGDQKQPGTETQPSGTPKSLDPTNPPSGTDKRSGKGSDPSEVDGLLARLSEALRKGLDLSPKDPTPDAGSKDGGSKDGGSKK